MEERAKRRLETFRKALNSYEKTVRNPVDNEHTQSYALMHVFGLCFDLAWKCLKDLLEYKTTDTEGLGPKAIFTLANESGLIEKETDWRNLVEDRNISTHVYDEGTVMEIAERAADEYLMAFDSLYTTILSKYGSN